MMSREDEVRVRFWVCVSVALSTAFAAASIAKGVLAAAS